MEESVSNLLVGLAESFLMNCSHEGESHLIKRLSQLYCDKCEAFSTFSESRKDQFLKGRLCAHYVLEKLRGRQKAEELYYIAFQKNRAPLWPKGVVGSLSHCDDYFVALASDCLRAVGVDIERQARVKEGLYDKILCPYERQSLCQWGSQTEKWDIPTLIFSAKESLYKALNPHIGQFFGFQEACFCAINFEKQSFQIELLNRELVKGTDFPLFYEGHFCRKDQFIITAIEVV